MGEEELVMLHNALTSVVPFHNDVKVSIICPVKLNTELSSFIENSDFGHKLEITPLYHNKKTDFVSQINIGIGSCETEWFSILEIDDEYTPIWLPSMDEHRKSFNDVDVFLPIITDINTEGKFLNFTNESLWAYGFTDKQGYLDNSVLLEFQNYQTSGGLYRTKVIKDNGSFKDNIKLTFTYEFLLRLTNNGIIIMGVPRAGYTHVNFREDSLFWMYKNDEKMKITEDEVKFWLETAKKEYFFKNKRDITYVEK